MPADHEVRAITSVVDKLDLRGSTPTSAPAARSPAHRPPTPRSYWALGLCHATSDGVGSGREIARLVELHAAYRWLCGGVAVADHRLNDFRSDHGDVFSELVTQLLAWLMKHDLIDLHRVAQDGTRIRASTSSQRQPPGKACPGALAAARGGRLIDVAPTAPCGPGRRREPCPSSEQNVMT